MHNEFSAIIEKDDDWYIAYSPEIPGANGKGRTVEEAKEICQGLSVPHVKLMRGKCQIIWRNLLIFYLKHFMMF